VVGSLECDEGIREDTVVVETNWLDVADTQGQERVNISQFASMTGDPFVGTPRIHGVPVCLRKMARSLGRFFVAESDGPKYFPS